MKYTLIIDGHNFLFRTVYVLPQKKGQLLLSSDEERDMFCSKLEQNLNAVLRDVQDVADRCVFVLDSQSWRKSLELGVDYKGTRHNEETINWEGFQECMNRFTETLPNYGITVSRTNGAEADDLIFYWSQALVGKEIPVIMYTSDRDMLQLVRIYEHTDVLLYSDVTKKIYVPEGFDGLNESSKMSLMDLLTGRKDGFDPYDRFSNIEQLIKKKKLDKIEVNADKCRYTKVLVGDKSDNISSIYSYVKNGKTYNVTEKKAESILENFVSKVGNLDSEYLYLDDTLNILCDCCFDTLKLSATEDTANAKISELEKNGEPYSGSVGDMVSIMNAETKSFIKNNLQTNIKYIVLSAKVIPQAIVQNMYADIKKLGKEMKKINFSNVNANKESIIKKTEGVFKDVDDGDMSFIKNNKTLF